jgi:hypothetical protein
VAHQTLIGGLAECGRQKGKNEAKKKKGTKNTSLFFHISHPLALRIYPVDCRGN